MAAVTAAVVVAGATVAATAYQASQAGGGPDSLAEAGYIGPGAQERLFNRGTRAILDAERAILDDAAAQGKQLEPEMYRALGLEPIYDREEDPEIGGLSEALAGKKQQLAQLQQQKAQIQAGKAAGGMRGGKGTGGAKRTKAVKQLNKQLNLLNREIGSITTDLEQRGAVGRRVVGFKPLGGVADPTGSSGNAFGAALDSFNDHLANALSGKEPIDPTLKSSFDEKERTLRERLRRQMGPDYETSTAGRQAMANFDRERAEAFARYNTEAIGYFSNLAEGRATTLSRLTADRIKNLSLPSALRSQMGLQLGQAANDRSRYAESLQGERVAKGNAQARLAEAKAQQDAARAQAIAGLIQSTGSGVGAAGPALDSYLSPTAAPDTVEVPSYNSADSAVGPYAAGYKVGDDKVNALLGKV